MIKLEKILLRTKNTFHKDTIMHISYMGQLRYRNFKAKNKKEKGEYDQTIIIVGNFNVFLS